MFVSCPCLRAYIMACDDTKIFCTNKHQYEYQYKHSMLIFRCRLTHQAVQTIYQTALTRGIICLHGLVCYWANAIYSA